MRSHKPPKESLISRLSEVGSFKQVRNYAKKGWSPENLALFSQQNGMSGTHCMVFYESLRYILGRPSDVILDGSLLSYLESQSYDNEIKPLDIDRQLWVDFSKFNLRLADGSKAMGCLFVKVNDFSGEYYQDLYDFTTSTQGEVLYCAWVLVDHSFILLPISTGTTYDNLLATDRKIVQVHNQEVSDETENLVGRVVAYALMAMQLIQEGHFTKDTVVYEDRSMPTVKKKIKPKGKKTKKRVVQCYKQFRTTTFRHVESAPQTRELPSYTPSENPTPRNVTSHFKERWVTEDYIENHQVPYEDIIELEDRTRLYKNGEGTKLWAKIKIWFDYKSDWLDEPVQEIEKYRI